MAIVAERQITLKDGTVALIRSGNELDTDCFQQHIDDVLEDGAGMSASPGEIVLTSAAKRSWIANTSENPDELFLVVIYDGMIIGNIDFHIGKRNRTKHVGTFGMSVRPGWRGKGIGGELLDALLEWAQANPRVEKINLRVLASNEAAIGLYRKKGFVEEGRQKDEIKYADGSYADDLLMARLVR